MKVILNCLLSYSLKWNLKCHKSMIWLHLCALCYLYHQAHGFVSNWTVFSANSLLRERMKKKMMMMRKMKTEKMMMKEKIKKKKKIMIKRRWWWWRRKRWRWKRRRRKRRSRRKEEDKYMHYSDICLAIVTNSSCMCMPHTWPTVSSETVGAQETAHTSLVHWRHTVCDWLPVITHVRTITCSMFSVLCSRFSVRPTQYRFWINCHAVVSRQRAALCAWWEVVCVIPELCGRSSYLIEQVMRSLGDTPFSFWG